MNVDSTIVFNLHDSNTDAFNATSQRRRRQDLAAVPRRFPPVKRPNADRALSNSIPFAIEDLAELDPALPADAHEIRLRCELADVADTEVRDHDDVRRNLE